VGTEILIYKDGCQMRAHRHGMYGCAIPLLTIVFGSIVQLMLRCLFPEMSSLIVNTIVCIIIYPILLYSFAMFFQNK